MTRKLNPKIIRVGDVVQITNPEFFIRCGYPLSMEDMRAEVQKYFGKHISDLMLSIGGEKLITSDATNSTIWTDDYGSNPWENRAYLEVVDGLAYARLCSKKFGGNTRQLFTTRNEEHMGKKARVEAIRIVKTGTRDSGSYHSMDGDYDPPCLMNEKTHKILTVDFYREANGGGFIVGDYPPNEIEAIHVKKIVDRLEMEKTCGILCDFEKLELSK